MLDRIAVIAAVSAVSALFVSASPSSSGPDLTRHPTAFVETAAPAPKGDRLAAPVAKAYRSPVASLMKSGEGAGMSVSMRDPLGKVVYLSDPAAAYTAVARDANYLDLPVEPPAAPRPVVAQVTGKMPVGCDRTVSVLTGSSAARRASRCIT